MEISRVKYMLIMLSMVIVQALAAYGIFSFFSISAIFSEISLAIIMTIFLFVWLAFFFPASVIDEAKHPKALMLFTYLSNVALICSFMAMLASIVDLSQGSLLTSESCMAIIGEVIILMVLFGIVGFIFPNFVDKLNYYIGATAAFVCLAVLSYFLFPGATQGSIFINEGIIVLFGVMSAYDIYHAFMDDPTYYHAFLWAGRIFRDGLLMFAKLSESSLNNSD